MFCQELEITYFPNGKLKLIQPKIEHAEVSLEWVKDHEVIQYMGADFSNPTLEGEQKRIQKILDNSDEYNWMIELDGKIIGNVSLNDIQEKTEEFRVKAANFTILIGDKNYWGKGIGYVIGQRIIEWVFDEAIFELLFARALEPNIASIKTLLKLGFKKTGTSPYETLIHGKKADWINFKLTY